MLKNIMSPIETFQIYQALRLHFTQENYDALKYNFKTRVNRNSFEARRDKYTFEKLARSYTNREDLINFFVANFTNNRMYVRDMNLDNVINRNKWLESLSYNFETDIKKLVEEQEKFDDWCDKNNQKTFVWAYARGQIALETITIIDILTNFLKSYANTYDPLGLERESVMCVKKYRPFFSLTKAQLTKCKNIICSNFN
jgi:hypothetical protein